MMDEGKRSLLGRAGYSSTELLVVLAFIGIVTVAISGGCWSKREQPRRTTFGGSNDARLVGKWELLDGKFKGTTADFTSGGKVVATLTHEWMPSEDKIATYSANGTILRINSGQGAFSESVTLEVEFQAPDAIVMVVKDGHAFGFDEFGGRWQRVGGLAPTPNFPGGPDSKGSDESFAPNPNDPPALAQAKQRLRSFEQKRVKMEPLLDKALADRDDLVAKLREIGVNSLADLKGNIRGQRLAELVQKITTEIAGLEKQISSLDSAILDAKSVIRRIEREAVSISEVEMLKLAEQLRDVEDRTDGSRLPVTPIEVDTALADAFKARPKSKHTKGVTSRPKPRPGSTGSTVNENDPNLMEWNKRLTALRKIRAGMTIEQVENILGLADETGEDGNDPSGGLAKRGETLTILTWRGDDPSEDGDFIKIGFINGRINDLKLIEVNAAK